MDPQFQELAREISETVTNAVEKRLQGHLAKQLSEMSEQLDEKLTKGVNDIKHQARLNMEELKTQVKAAADGYGGTLEGIQRELKDLNERITSLEQHR